MIAIRPLELANIQSFVDIHLKCFEETYYGIFPQEVIDVRWNKRNDRVLHVQKRMLEESNYFYYCLYDDFHIVGIMIFSILDGVGILDALYLMKDYQGYGYGTKMLQQMESVLEERGVLEYSIYVFPILKANNFFLKNGSLFVQEDMISIHGKDYKEIEYVKKIGG